MKHFYKLLITNIFCVFSHVVSVAQSPESLATLETRLEQARQLLNIPGMTVGVAKGDKMIWSKGFGLADVAQNKPATEQTTYHIASLTKTFASFIIMRLVEQGKLKLDDPISKYTDGFGKTVLVRHLLTHTSEGTPGTIYSYNGYRFAFLDRVISQAAGRSFVDLVQEWIIEPLQLSSTTPNLLLSEYFEYIRQYPAWEQRYSRVYNQLASPYQLRQGKPYKSFYEPYTGVSAGLISTVADLVRYSSAIDKRKIVSASSQQQILTPSVTTDGQQTPYGYGWFVQQYGGKTIWWHYGQDRSNSALLLKLPDDDLTFVVLANSIGLSQAFNLGAGDVSHSLFAQHFLQTVVFPKQLPIQLDWSNSPEVTEKQFNNSKDQFSKDFYLKQIVARASAHSTQRDSVRAAALYDLYYRLKAEKSNQQKEESIIASSGGVADNQTVTKPFSLSEDAKIRVLAVGEMSPFNHELWDWGWIEDEKGSKVWEMSWDNTKPAGIEPKLRKVDATLSLPKGNYKLFYKADDGFSYNSWGTAPPDINQWGLTVFRLLK